MTKNPTEQTVLIDSSEVAAHIPDYDDNIRCPDHPTAKVVSSFGLAGGGYGPYTYCDICCRILSKTSEPMEDSST